MKNLKIRFSITAALAIAALLIGIDPSSSTAADRIKLKAKDPRLNRLVTGTPTFSVAGVPASPVDSFVWDGVGSTNIKGKAKLDIDPIANTGKISAKWEDVNGKWKWTQTVYSPPGHPTGLRLDQDASGGPTATMPFHWPPPFPPNPPPPFVMPPYVGGDPITTDVYLHGNTFAGGPVLPTLFNHQATWGPCEITLDGQPFLNPFDGPAPDWFCHTMITRGARNSDGTVRTNTGGGPLGGDGVCADNTIFSPSLVWPFTGPTGEEDGCVDYNDLEFHMVFHDAPTFPVTTLGTGNFPPAFDFFYHVVFETVEFEEEQK